MDFLKKYLYNENGEISNTKAGLWIEIVLGLLKHFDLISTHTWQGLALAVTGIIGVGIRDIFPKKK